MKSSNKIIKKTLKKENFSIGELKEELKENGCSDEMIKDALKDGNWWGYGFAPFSLTNNNAKIKSTRKKVLIMKVRIERKATWEDIKFTEGYITIEDDRVKIFHESKPEKGIITEIKSNGFRWSPNWKCWCSKHTGNAIYAAKQLSFVKK